MFSEAWKCGKFLIGDMTNYFFACYFNIGIILIWFHLNAQESENDDKKYFYDRLTNPHHLLQLQVCHVTTNKNNTWLKKT